MPDKKFMGARVRRREDPRFITGSATYVDDIELPNMLHLAILRSPYPHALIASVNTDEALNQPGVVAVVTGEEVQDLVPPREGEADGESGPPPRPALSWGKVRYVGDPVVAVAATDRGAAVDALETIAIEYEELPGIGDAEEAMQPGAPQIHDYAEDNVDDRRDFEHGNAEAAFAEADCAISLRMVEQRLSPNSIETRGAVAAYEPGADVLTIWSSTQCAHFVRDALCDAFRLPKNKVRAISPDVGGGFGGKIGAYPEDVLVAYMARKLHRPVKWIETRSEHLQATIHGRSQIAYLDLASTAEGRITGLRLKLLGDSGAYGASWAPQTSAGMVTGCYDIPNVKSETITVLTNKSPLGAYRGAGRPEAAYYIERGIDNLGRALHMDPADIRKKNFIPPDAFPYDAPDWPEFDTGEYASTLDTALERSGYEEMRREQQQARDEGRLMGIGLSSYVEVCGFGWDTATVRMEADASVSIYTGISPHGQGQETTFAQIAADVLGVEPETVNVHYGDTSMGTGFGTMGSRGTAVGGTAVYRASGAVRDKMRRIAANLLESAEDKVELVGGSWQVAGSMERSVSVAEVAEAAYGSDLPEGVEPGLTATNNFRPEALTAPFGSHVCQVEIDRETGKVEILKYFSVDDCGRIVSPQLVQGQVQGGIAQGIAQAVFEEVAYDENGTLLTGNLVDYGFPTAMELPDYQTSHTTTPTPYNELGVKGIGEAATIGSTPAVANAVIDALAPLGIDRLDMPFTPFKVWQAIRDAESKQLPQAEKALAGVAP